MKTFHFDIGDSTKGPIGLCAVVTAETREQALIKLRNRLPDDLMIPVTYSEEDYIQIFFNGGAITVRDIDETNTASIDL